MLGILNLRLMLRLSKLAFYYENAVIKHILLLFLSIQGIVIL